MISNYNKIPERKPKRYKDAKPPTTLYVLFKKSKPLTYLEQHFTSDCIGRIKFEKFIPFLTCGKIIVKIFGPNNVLNWYTDQEWSESEEWLSMYPGGYIDIKNKTLKEGKE